MPVYLQHTTFSICQDFINTNLEHKYLDIPELRTKGRCRDDKTEGKSWIDACMSRQDYILSGKLRYYFTRKKVNCRGSVFYR